MSKETSQSLWKFDHKGPKNGHKGYKKAHKGIALIRVILLLVLTSVLFGVPTTKRSVASQRDHMGDLATYGHMDTKSVGVNGHHMVG